MPPEVKVEVEPEGTGPAELEAKAAEVSAEHAAEAAAAAMTMAAVSAAAVEQEAAEKVEAWQTELEIHRQQTGQALANLSDRLSEIDSREAERHRLDSEMRAQLAEIQSILSPPEPPPDEAQNPEGATDAAAAPEAGTPGSEANPASTEVLTDLLAPASEPPQAKRRAHRWI